MADAALKVTVDPVPPVDLDDDAKPVYWDEAAAILMARDRILRRIIPQHDASWLRPGHTPFAALALELLGQRRSAVAAQAAWQALTRACGGRASPSAVVRLAQQDASLGGLPARKASYVLDLAEHFHDRRIRPSGWREMDDDAIVAQLRGVRGIGQGTADLFLMFNLRRPDILPLDDASLLRAISLHYFSGEPVSRFEAREVAQAWAPWRSVASWYLWRSMASPGAPA